MKLLGDGAMLLFPESAVGVDAALDLVETMSGEGALVAHAGIHSGPVIERDLDVFGRTVNLASRIADVAEPGEVLASDAVAEAAHDGSYGFEPLEVAYLKGIPEPVPLFRVTRSDQPSPPRQDDEGTEPHRMADATEASSAAAPASSGERREPVVPPRQYGTNVRRQRADHPREETPLVARRGPLVSRAPDTPAPRAA